MRCDLCGKEGNLFRTLVEGTELNVCKECSSFGRVLKRSFQGNVSSSNKPVHSRFSRVEKPEVVEFIKDDIGMLIKKKREKLGWKQEELAKKVAVKESVIHNIESGHFIPSIEMAKRIGKFLNLSLTEEIKDEKIEKRKEIDDRELTLGDMIEIKMRKKK